MIICYWDCKYNDFHELGSGEDEYRIYGCSSPQNTNNHICHVDPWGGVKEECPWAELDDSK